MERMLDTVEPEDELRRQPREAIRRDGPELRARITDHLYEMLTRDAATRRLPMAELARRILAALRAELAEVNARASAERNALFAMLNLMYKGLLLRLDRIPTEELEERAAAADDGHQKLRDALTRQLSTNELDDLVDALSRTPSDAIGRARTPGCFSRQDT